MRTVNSDWRVSQRRVEGKLLWRDKVRGRRKNWRLVIRSGTVCLRRWILPAHRNDLFLRLQVHPEHNFPVTLTISITMIEFEQSSSRSDEFHIRLPNHLQTSVHQLRSRGVAMRALMFPTSPLDGSSENLSPMRLYCRSPVYKEPHKYGSPRV